MAETIQKIESRPKKENDSKLIQLEEKAGQLRAKRDKSTEIAERLLKELEAAAKEVDIAEINLELVRDADTPQVSSTHNLELRCSHVIFPLGSKSWAVV